MTPPLVKSVARGPVLEVNTNPETDVIVPTEVIDLVSARRFTLNALRKKRRMTASRSGLGVCFRTRSRDRGEPSFLHA